MGSACQLFFKTAIIVGDRPADTPARVTHGGTDPVDGLFCYQRFKARGLPAGLFVGETVMGEHQAQDPVTLDKIVCILSSITGKADPTIRLMDHQAICTELCNHLRGC